MMGFSRKRQEGIAAVEFGLIAPIVLVVLIAIFEFGLAFWRKQVLTAAVREGARKGIVATAPKKTDGDITEIVKNYLVQSGWDSGKANVSTTGAGGASGSNLTVTATYPTSFLILSQMKYGGNIAVDGDGNLILDATITMQME